MSKSKVIPCIRAEDGKGAGTDSGKSGTRNKDAENISGAECMGG